MRKKERKFCRCSIKFAFYNFNYSICSLKIDILRFNLVIDLYFTPLDIGKFNYNIKY